MLNKFNLNPFSGQSAGINAIASPPVGQTAPKTSGMPGTGNPFNKASFGHLAGISKNGPGSLLRAEPGQTGLGDKAVQLGNNKTLGKNLYISI